MRKLSIFITADALLAAVLLMWAQLWTTSSAQFWVQWYFLNDTAQQEYRKLLERFDFNTGIGLAWTYIAVLFALLALVWVAYRSITQARLEETPKLSIVLFINSLAMTILNVGQSIISIIWKLFDPNFNIWETTTKASCWMPYFLGGVIIAIFVVSICAVYSADKHIRYETGWSKKNKIWIIYLAIILVAIAVVVVSWMMELYR